MIQLLVRPIDQSEDNIIIPQSVQGAEDQIVYLKNPKFKKISYYINISGGLVIIGLDEHKVLKDIKISINRGLWKEEEDLNLPAYYKLASLEFTHILERSNELELPVLARTNSFRSFALFSWIDTLPDPPALWIALSEFCFAQISENKFIGLLVKVT